VCVGEKYLLQTFLFSSLRASHYVDFLATSSCAHTHARTLRTCLQTDYYLFTREVILLVKGERVCACMHARAWQTDYFLFTQEVILLVGLSVCARMHTRAWQTDYFLFTQEVILLVKVSVCACMHARAWQTDYFLFTQEVILLVGLSVCARAAACRIRKIGIYAICVQVVSAGMQGKARK
jgi:hypothetical protein